MTILKLLRNNAKSWWHHADLRKYGQHKEARLKEHRSIRENIATLRDTIKSKGYGSVGRGGYSLHYIKSSQGSLTYGTCSQSGYGDVNSAIIQAAIRLGIPVYDSTVIPDDKIVQVIKFPMIGLKEIDNAPYNSLSYAPKEYVFDLYKQLGARVYNFERLK